MPKDRSDKQEKLENEYVQRHQEKSAKLLDMEKSG